MNIDNVYSAAINGNLVELENILKSGEVDLNEVLDGGVNDGLHSKFTVLFSVLNAMSTSGFNYNVLDMLVDYGLDLSKNVTLSTDAFSFGVPILFYAITVWNSTELLEYLLRRGSWSNASKYEYYQNHMEKYPMTYFAITSVESPEMLRILLKYGADPNEEIITYIKEDGTTQTIPPLFYAVVKQQSLEKTQLLFQYGALIGAQVDLGKGWRYKHTFDSYIERVYGNPYNKLMKQAYSQALGNRQEGKLCFQQHPKAPNKVDAAPKAVEPTKTEPTVKTQKAVELTDREKLAEKAKSLMHFYHGQPSKYRECVKNSEVKGGSIFTAKKRKQEAADAAANAQKILQTHKELIAELNELKAAVSTPVNDWWNSYDGFSDTLGNVAGVIWMPFKRIVERNNGYYLASLHTEEKPVPGTVLKRFFELADTKLIYMADSDMQGEYSLAEICGWSIYDPTYISTENISGPEHEIKKKLTQYDESMDDRERLRNMIAGEHWTTDSERYAAGRMSDYLFMINQMERQEKYNEYEKQIRSMSRRVAVNAEVYFQSFAPLGIVAFDKDGVVAALAVYNEPHQVERFKVGDDKLIYGFEYDGLTHGAELETDTVIRAMQHYPMPNIDPLSFAPDGIDRGDWLKFMFMSAYSGLTAQYFDMKTYIKDETQKKLKAAADKKIVTLLYGSPND